MMRRILTGLRAAAWWAWRNLAVVAVVIACIAVYGVVAERDARRTADIEARAEQAEDRARQADQRLIIEREARIANARSKQLSGRDSCQVNNARYSTIYAALRLTAIAQGYPPESYADLTAALAPTNCITKYPMPDAKGNVPRGTDDQTVRFRSCEDARKAGMTPLYRGQPLYGANPELDGDGDGIACE